MSVTDPYRHRIRLPAGAEATVAVGDEVKAGDPVASSTRPGTSVSVPLARPLHRGRDEVVDLLVVAPGGRLRVDQPIARTPDRDVRSPVDGIMLAYDPSKGDATVLGLEPSDPILSDVRGIVMEVSRGAVTIAVPAVMLAGVAGSGAAVHGPLTIAVTNAEAPLEPAMIDADAAGRIMVGGSWASAEVITRARAVGVAGIIVGGLHARELSEFTGLQHRRSLLGTAAPPIAVLGLDGFGRSTMDPARFAWLQAHADQSATILGDQRRLLVYDAAPAPARVARAAIGDRVVIASGPGRGQAGLLTEVPGQPQAIGSGISALCGLVRLDAGRTVAVALANLEASPSLS
jgi:hypothetical protein